MIYLIYTLLFTGIILVLSAFLPGKGKEIKQRLPGEVVMQGKKRKISFNLMPVSFISNFILSRLKLKEKLQQGIHAAKLKLTSVEFFNIKFITMIVCGGIIYFAFSTKREAIFIASIVGFFLPDIWLIRRIKKHKELIARQLPETIDLLGLCIEAGLDFTAAIEWMMKKIKQTAVIEEFSFVLEEIKWGKSRAEALKDMSKRLNMLEITSFVNTLVQAERMGTPVVEAFSLLAEDARIQRYHRGQRYALQAPIKMLFPLVFCILPVIGIIIGGPILIQFTQGKLF